MIGIIATPKDLKPSPAEVDAVFDMPLHIFLENDAAVHGYVDAQYSIGQAVSYRIHSFQYKEFTIWGLTAGILIEAAALALGRWPEFQVMPGDYSYADIVFDGDIVRVRTESKF